jgi:uncharacterized protein (UPF0262 family)
MREKTEKRPDALVEVTIDEASIGRGTPDQEHERAIAIYDLVEEGAFSVPGLDPGPFALRLALQDAKLTFEFSEISRGVGLSHVLSLASLRSLLKDYFLICETYYAAIRDATPARIEALDHSRRALHDEAAVLLRERMAGKIDVDGDTARRLFTLIAALHWKG